MSESIEKAQGQMKRIQSLGENRLKRQGSSTAGFYKLNLGAKSPTASTATFKELGEEQNHVERTQWEANGPFDPSNFLTHDY